MPILLWWPLQSWRWLRWTCWSAWRSVARQTKTQGASFEHATSVPLRRQRSRALRLALAHGIMAGDSYAFGLLADDATGSWPEFLFTTEAGWNVAASSDSTAARRHSNLLADKQATNDFLIELGIPVVPSLLTSDVLAGLDEWPDAYAKPRFGSRASGAFAVSRTDAGLVVVPPQEDDPVADPTAYIAAAVAGREYLVQPRLRSHPLMAEVADPADVVTARVVTRDTGAGSAVFSCALEVPLARSDGHRIYAHICVGPDGVVGEEARLRWQAAPEDDADRGAEIERTLRGQVLPGFDEVCRQAVAAHGELPGLFAVAWDVAFTDSGWLFLEGNTGFATLVPQLIAGPILRGLESKGRSG